MDINEDVAYEWETVSMIYGETAAYVAVDSGANVSDVVAAHDKAKADGYLGTPRATTTDWYPEGSVINFIIPKEHV